MLALACVAMLGISGHCCWRSFVFILVRLSALQLHIVDGALLRSNPALVMEGIQKFLGVTPVFNYTQALMSVTHKHTHTLPSRCLPLGQDIVVLLSVC